MVSVAAGCAAVVPETVAGGSSHQRPRVAGSSAGGFGEGRPGKTGRRRRRPGTPVGHGRGGRPNPGSRNAGLTSRAMASARHWWMIRSAGGRQRRCRRDPRRRFALSPAMQQMQSVQPSAVVAGMARTSWVDRASSAPYLVVSLSNSSDRTAIDAYSRALAERVGPRGVTRSLSSTGPCPDEGAVRLFRLGAPPESRLQVFGISAEFREPAHD